MENNCYNTYEINIHLRNTTAWSVDQKLGVIFPKSQQRECSSMKVLYQRGSTTPTLQYPNKKYSQKEEDETVGGLWRPTDPE
jgi:hypothetical protein